MPFGKGRGRKIAGKRKIFGKTFVDRNQKFVPLYRDSEEPGQELKRSGTPTLTKRHFKGHEAVIHRRRSPTL